MALSEHEQRLLDEMEMQLKADDPRLASSLGSARSSSLSVRRVLVGSLAGLAGLALLILGLSVHIIALSIVGFVLMGLGAWIATSHPKASRESTKKAAAANASKSKFMSNLENKWDQRKGDF